MTYHSEFRVQGQVSVRGPKVFQLYEARECGFLCRVLGRSQTYRRFGSQQVSYRVGNVWFRKYTLYIGMGRRIFKRATKGIEKVDIKHIA